MGNKTSNPEGKTPEQCAEIRGNFCERLAKELGVDISCISPAGGEADSNAYVVNVDAGTDG